MYWTEVIITFDSQNILYKNELYVVIKLKIKIIFHDIRLVLSFI